MEKIVIIGAGGFGREVKTLIDQINERKNIYSVEGYYDDNLKLGKQINGLPLLGTIGDLLRREDNISVAMGIGIPTIKEEVFKKLSLKKFNFPTLIHPNVFIGKDEVTIGKGCIICANNIITCNISIGDFVTLNLSCTTGHDTKISNFASFMPSVNISGEVIIGKAVYVGTGAKIINQLEISKNTIVGAGAVVTNSLPANCTAVGIPAKPIKFHNKNS